MGNIISATGINTKATPSTTISSTMTMLKPTRRSLEVLAEREGQRTDYSRFSSIMTGSVPRGLTPKRMEEPAVDASSFYGVRRSAKQRSDNRYSNIYAYDRTAVIIGDKGYVNANVVCDSRGSWWVASQAPVPTSMYNFFRAIHDRSASAHPALIRKPNLQPENRAAIIVQLTGHVERGMKKSDPYLPSSGQTSSFVGTIGDELLLISSSECHVPEIGSTHTTLRLVGNDRETAIHHYMFDHWPDHGVPSAEGVTLLKNLVFKVGKLREELGGVDECEVWVHCSAGVGRTGTFIALSSLLLPPPSHKPIAPLPASPLGPLPSDVADDIVVKTVDGLREWRNYLCQTDEQVVLLYSILG